MPLAHDIRQKSLAQAKFLGYPTNPELPLLEPSTFRRSLEEVSSRALVLNCIVAAAWGYPKEDALSWLKAQSLTGSLTRSERSFLLQETTDSDYRHMAECLWVFAWVLGKAEPLDFGRYCPDTLVELYPDLDQNEGLDRWNASLHMRQIEEIYAMLDLSYCLHWGITHSVLSGIRLRVGVPQHVVVERRRALEWLSASDEWDDVDMST